MKYFIIFLVFVVGGGVVYAAFSFPPEATITYEATDLPIKKKQAAHLLTPEPLKGVYMTSCIASRPDLRSNMVKLLEETELNAVVIDIKDYTGIVSFQTGNEAIDKVSEMGKGCQTKDMEQFMAELHNKNIYVIGRVTVFQDPLYTKIHPESAVKRLSEKQENWKDRKGLSFVDVGAKDYWDHVVAIATSSYAIGFDEINFDYIRFPSDGDMKDIYYAHAGTTTKREMLRQFFAYLDGKLTGTGIITSADLFGMTTTNTDDLNIGQVLEYALVHFDYVAPMVYPSHYPPQFNGWPDPNKVPYEIVKFSMQSAVSKLEFMEKEIASTSPESILLLKRLNPLQLRPWLQDNDYPVHYTPAMVRAQMQATYDSGLTSWMLWDPRNEYTREALLEE